MRQNKIHGFTWVEQDWIGLMIFNNFADQDWIGFNFCESGLDSDWKISQSTHLCYKPDPVQTFWNRSRVGVRKSDSGNFLTESFFIVKFIKSEPRILCQIRLTQSNSNQNYTLIPLPRIPSHAFLVSSTQIWVFSSPHGCLGLIMKNSVKSVWFEGINSPI